MLLHVIAPADPKLVVPRILAADTHGILSVVTCVKYLAF